MSTQKLASKKPQIRKWILIAAITVSSLALLVGLLVGVLDFDLPQGLAYGVAILYLLFSCAAAIFYLMRKEQAAAARVWGILGGLPLGPFGVIGFPVFIVAIGGAVLVPTKPKLAGGLMLVGAIMSVAGLVFLIGLFTLNGPTGLHALLTTMPFLLATSFLIPGGILALTSRKGQPASKKMAIVAITALFALFLWPVLYLIPYYF